MVVMNGENYLTMKEMAEAISVSYSALDSWVRKKIIEPAFVSPTGRKFFSQEQVDAYFRGEYSKKG